MIDRAWQTVADYASVILRQYEKDHAEDLALKSLYYRQHEHDDLRTLFPNPEIDEEEAEAADVLRNIDKFANDGAVFGAEATALDGNWGNVQDKDKEFQEYDKYLHDHPEEDKEDCGAALCAPKSMLHLSLIQETVANNPENKAKAKSRSRPQQQQESK